MGKMATRLVFILLAGIAGKSDCHTNKRFDMPSFATLYLWEYWWMERTEKRACR